MLHKYLIYYHRRFLRDTLKRNFWFIGSNMGIVNQVYKLYMWWKCSHKRDSFHHSWCNYYFTQYFRIFQQDKDSCTSCYRSIGFQYNQYNNFLCIDTLNKRYCIFSKSFQVWQTSRFGYNFVNKYDNMCSNIHLYNIQCNQQIKVHYINNMCCYTTYIHCLIDHRKNC